MIYNNLDTILEQEGFSDKKEIIMRMHSKNNDFILSDFRIIEDRYINSLGEDKINFISCFPEIVERTLKLNNKTLHCLVRIIDYYQETVNREDWSVLYDRLLSNCEDFKELINSIDRVEELSINQIIKLKQILMQNNFLGITDINQIDDYDILLQEYVNKLYLDESFEGKESYKRAILIKEYSISYELAKELVLKYGESIDFIEDENLKNFIRALDNLISESDYDVLEKKWKELKNERIQIDIVEIESKLKIEYMKLYNRDLFNIENAIKNEKLGENIFELPVDDDGYIKDFNMIITSIAPFIKNDPDNYYEDWNRPEIGSQHFCANYIRRDELGRAPCPHLCFGFNNLSEDSLILLGNSDLASSNVSFVSKAKRNERYLAPDALINDTIFYNEIDIRRVQHGIKKQPDYIVVFRVNGSISNMDLAKKVSNEFREATGKPLPILVVDQDKCIETERYLLDRMIEEYKDRPSKEKLTKIKQKIKNNRVINSKFAYDIEIEDLESFEITSEYDQKNENIEEDFMAECITEESRKEFLEL